MGRSGYGTVSGVRAGSDGLSGEQIVEQHGAWVPPTRAQDVAWAGMPADQIFLVNPKLQLVYTLDDLHARRPLPNPYPLNDDGAGLFFPDANDPNTGAAWTPIGNRVHEVYREYYQRVGAALQRYKQRGQSDDAHEAALTLVRFAYAFPTLDYSRYLTSTVHDPGPFGRDYSCRRRETVAFFLPHYPMYVDPLLYQYDELFDLIRDNQPLADSVGRFVPWVKTPRDVIRLIDMYLVQTTAKRILRYHYHTDPMDIANLATVVGDRRVTDPWMEWLFSRTFIYPLPVGGIQDTMISGTNREGTEFVGSTYYAQGEGASRVAASLDQYLRRRRSEIRLVRPAALSQAGRPSVLAAGKRGRRPRFPADRRRLRAGQRPRPYAPRLGVCPLRLAMDARPEIRVPPAALPDSRPGDRRRVVRNRSGGGAAAAHAVAGQPLARAAHLGRHPGIGRRTR